MGVVVAKGHKVDTTLTSKIGFPAGPVDEETGMTSIPGIFAIGFDPPGSGRHHFGYLPGRKYIYDNWLAWGINAVPDTCDEIAAISRLSQSPWAKISQSEL